ncbi:SWI5-dependent HO expression protein 2 [Monosporozyma unispora]|nr:swi5p-dependent ho expression [Kazachstania unispora]
MSVESEYGADELVITDDIQFALESILDTFSQYLSSHIHVLNKFISHLRRVGALKYERTNLIKFVKKLRYFNDSLQISKDTIFQDTHVGDHLESGVVPIASDFVKILEVIDLLKFIFTNSLQKEIISKTLNFDLTINEDCIQTIEDTFKIFVKYTQWMLESIDAQTNLTRLEVVSSALKFAAEDQEDDDNEGETDNIFVQEIIQVQDSLEYCALTTDWDNLLRARLNDLEIQFEATAANWQDKFGKKK